jgi:hypothetical protein
MTLINFTLTSFLIKMDVPLHVPLGSWSPIGQQTGLFWQTFKNPATVAEFSLRLAGNDCSE